MSSARRADPFGVAALAAAGAMAGHEIGYLSETGGTVVSHDYFGILGPVVVMALCVAAWGGAVNVLRRDAGRAPSFGLLLLIQSGLFVTMEVGERVTAGSMSSLFSLPVFLGLLLQPIVAWVALRLLATGRRVVEAFRSPAAPTLPSPALPLASWPADVVVDIQFRTRLRVRGPPMV